METFATTPHNFAGLDVTVMSLGGTKDTVIVDDRELIGRSKVILILKMTLNKHSLKFYVLRD